MPRKYLKKTFSAPKRKRAPRRRLGVGAAVASVPAIYEAVKTGYGLYDKFSKGKRRIAKRVFQTRVEESDNITTAPTVTIGKQRKISFQEKVARTVRQPFLFKRNYQWSAECAAGRKAFFSIEINPINNTDLLQDITTYKSVLFTNTSSPDGQVSANGLADGAQFYVDRLVEKLSMVNSSSNSITGKIHLIAYKRDCAGNYSTSGAILQPINMAMYYSTNSVGLQLAGVGAEQTVGNGWSFDAATGGSSWASGYQMPGSSFNPTGVCANADPAFSLFSTHIKEKMNFWFRNVKTTTFSLKPGQQINSNYIFNDLPVLHRELQEYSHVPGISFSMVVEFIGGIVGDNTAVTGNGVISTGSCQLSCIRTSQRTLGVKNYIRSNVVLQTAPLTQILIGSQVIINADTGVALSGTVLDA